MCVMLLSCRYCSVRSVGEVLGLFHDAGEGVLPVPLLVGAGWAAGPFVVAPAAREELVAVRVRAEVVGLREVLVDAVDVEFRAGGHHDVADHLYVRRWGCRWVVAVCWWVLLGAGVCGLPGRSSEC